MADILRVSIFGVMPGGEEWSINPVFEIGGGGGVTVTPAQALTMATNVAGVSPGAAMTAAWNTTTQLMGARVEARTLTGTLETQAEYVRTTGVAGTGAVMHPYQTAWVISLRTDRVGASGRGRLYWPATGQVLSGTDLRVSSGNVSSFLTAASTYLSTIETSISTTLAGSSLVVWSRTLNSVAAVNQLQVGNVLDTQRRRRDILLEVYTSTAY